MSKYTTGEIAKLCGISVRTVQYYDSRNILVPSELTEGGRRLYSEDDLKRMKIICFLRELDLPINTISQLLAEEHPENVIDLLLEQQEQSLRREIDEHQIRLSKLEALRRELKSVAHFSVDSIGDIAYAMENKKKMKKIHAMLLIMGLPMNVAQWTFVILGFIKGIWWPFFVYVLAAVPYGICLSKYYFKRVVYICPECHELFKPSLKEAFWAKHTPNTRKLTCTKCGHHGFCVETYGKEADVK